MFFYFIISITVITVLLCLVYLLVMGSYCYGWIKTRNIKTSLNGACSVAVIISARNEEGVISECLNAIINQSYPKNSLEIIVVDDNSTDSTSKIVTEYSQKHSNIKLIHLAEFNLIGKKNAITNAINSTKAELIITTDADCIMEKNWLQSIVSFYFETDAKMIVGPVAFIKNKTVFEKMQSLELFGLIGSTAGSLYFNKGIICNGANLAYPRTVFYEVNGFSNIDNQASGDDVLLMYRIISKYRKGVKFLKNEESIVYTHAKSNLKEFIHQRKRWASKGFSLLNSETRFLSLLVYLMNFMLVSSLLITGFASLKTVLYQPFFGICLILFGIKCIIDFLLLFLAARFFKRVNLLYLFVPEQFIYILYVIIIGILGNIGRYEWKGRILK